MQCRLNICLCFDHGEAICGSCQALSAQNRHLRASAHKTAKAKGVWNNLPLPRQSPVKKSSDTVEERDEGLLEGAPSLLVGDEDIQEKGVDKEDGDDIDEDSVEKSFNSLSSIMATLICSEVAAQMPQFKVPAEEKIINNNYNNLDNNINNNDNNDNTICTITNNYNYQCAVTY